MWRFLNATISSGEMLALAAALWFILAGVSGWLPDWMYR